MRMLLTALGLVVAIAAHADEDNDVLDQVSTIDALLSGVCDSAATVGSVTEASPVPVLTKNLIGGTRNG